MGQRKLGMYRVPPHGGAYHEADGSFLRAPVFSANICDVVHRPDVEVTDNYVAAVLSGSG